MDEADFGADPGADQCQRRNRRGGGVDDVGQLLARDAQLVIDRRHGGADNHGIGIVVEEHHKPRNPAHDLTALGIGRPAGSRLHHRPRSAVGCEHAHHSADQQREQNDL